MEATSDPKDIEAQVMERKECADKQKRGLPQDEAASQDFNRVRGKSNDTLSSVADAFKASVKQQGDAATAANAAAAERAEERRLVALRHAKVLAAQAASDAENVPWRRRLSRRRR